MRRRNPVNAIPPADRHVPKNVHALGARLGATEWHTKVGALPIQLRQAPPCGKRTLRVLAAHEKGLGLIRASVMPPNIHRASTKHLHINRMRPVPGTALYDLPGSNCRHSICSPAQGRESACSSVAHRAPSAERTPPGFNSMPSAPKLPTTSDLCRTRRSLTSANQTHGRPSPSPLHTPPQIAAV